MAEKKKKTETAPESGLTAEQLDAMADYINIIRSENKTSSPADDLRAVAEQLRNKKGYGVKNG